jgi:nucleoside triphosphate pyrophosphatase
MLILASQSPRRREILEHAGIPFEVRSAGVPEEIQEGETPVNYVLRLARAKAAAVNGELVLGADTVVVLDEHILEKPRDASDALRMLRILSGREHSVITGICLRSGDAYMTDAVETRVRFVSMSQDEMDAYVASGEPMDKAGGYAIQGLASKYIDRIEGDYFNVVGLPIHRVYAMIKSFGIREINPGVPVRS